MKNGCNTRVVFVSCAHNFQAKDSLTRPRPFFCFQSGVIVDEQKFRFDYAIF